MNLAELVEKAGQLLNIPDCKLGPSGVCQLIIDNRLQVSIEDNSAENSAHLYATVCKVPDNSKEALYAALLEAQLFAREIGEGCAFGLDQAAAEILLHRKFTLSGMDQDKFMEALNEFINWADHWQQKLASGQLEANEPEAAELSDSFEPPSMMMIRA